MLNKKEIIEDSYLECVEKYVNNMINSILKKLYLVYILMNNDLRNN